MPRVLDVVYASFMMPEAILDEKISRIRWYSLKNYDLKTSTDCIVDAIRDQKQTKNIVIANYQKFAGAIENHKITRCFDRIVDALRSQERNKIVFSTCVYVPSNSNVWKQVGELNEKIRLYNEMIDMPQLCLHKMATSWISEEDRTLRVRGMAFIEFQLGLGFGTNWSYEGLQKVKKYLINAFDIIFSVQAEKKKIRYASVPIPPPLIETDGYRKNEFHRQEIKARNLGGRPASTGSMRYRLTWSERKPEGWRHWEVYQKNPCDTKEERERALQDHLAELHVSSERPVWDDKEGQEPEHQAQREEQVDEPYDPEDMDLIVFSEDEEGDCVIVEDAQDVDREVEILARDLTINEDATEEEIEEIEYNEDEHGDDDGMGVNRYDQINEELVKQYRKELANKNAQICKERAASKHWKSSANKSENDNHVLVKDLEYYKRRVKVLEGQVKRISEEYKYLKGLYEQDGRKRQVLQKATDRKFAKKGDFVGEK